MTDLERTAVRRLGLSALDAAHRIGRDGTMTPVPTKGRLRVVLGAAPGVGKTFAMLGEGQRLASAGVDVVVAYADTHHREATEAKLQDLEQIPAKHVCTEGRRLRS